MPQMARLVRIVSGFALLGVGLVGLFLPVLQGILFIVAGLFLLAPEYHWARRLLNWLQRKREAASGSSPSSKH